MNNTSRPHDDTLAGGSLPSRPDAARRSFLAAWRDAVRDSGLGAVVKATAWCLATFANGRGVAFPSRTTLGHGASLSVRAVEHAIRQLERAGFLNVERGGGRRSNTYHLTIPGGDCEPPQRRTPVAPAANVIRPSGERRAPESSCIQSGGIESPACAAAALNGGAARRLIPDDFCAGCGERRPLVKDALYCRECAIRRNAARLRAGSRS